MAEEKEIEKEIEIDDPILSAAMVQFECTAESFLRPTGKVSFRVKGNIEAALSRIYANEKVPILDFIKEIKSLRNSIFVLRTTRPNNGQR